MTTQRAILVHGVAIRVAACSPEVQSLRHPELGWAPSMDSRTLGESEIAGAAEIHREWLGTYSVIRHTSGATHTDTGERHGDRIEARRLRSGANGRAQSTPSSTGVLHGTWSLDEGFRLGLETPTPDTNP